MVVAPGRMIDSFLSIPDAESLPLYRMVLKLACVCVCGYAMRGHLKPKPKDLISFKSRKFRRKFQFSNKELKLCNPASITRTHAVMIC